MLGCKPTLSRQKNGDVTTSKIRSSNWTTFQDAALAAELWERCQSSIPRQIAGTEVLGIHSDFEYLRYDIGQKYVRHKDIRVHLSSGETSRLTMLLYLNDDFVRGNTLFTDYDFLPGKDRHVHATNITPLVGSALFFALDRWHEGTPVTIGQKYVIRGDVMYSANPLSQ